jgi:hypothetical protein
LLSPSEVLIGVASHIGRHKAQCCQQETLPHQQYNAEETPYPPLELPEIAEETPYLPPELPEIAV